MKFETLAIAESYLNDYARLKGFCFRKRRRVADSSDDNITRRQTYECSHAGTVLIIQKRPFYQKIGVIGIQE